MLAPCSHTRESTTIPCVAQRDHHALALLRARLDATFEADPTLLDHHEHEWTAEHPPTRTRAASSDCGRPLQPVCLRMSIWVRGLLACSILCSCQSSDWLREYDRAIDELSAQYAFTEHKGLDWNAIDARIRPQIERADLARDSRALDQALRELVAAVPDNHMELSASECPHTERGFGIVLSDTDESGVVVAWAQDGTGIEPGERVLSWNGVPIEDARLSAPTECLHEGVATPERLAFEELRYLVRGGVGAPGELVTDRGVHRLVANETGDDSFEAFERSSADCSRIVCHRIEGDIGIVSLSTVEGSSTISRIRRAISEFLEAGVRGVVFDLRGNNGGSDDLAARIAGFFHAERMFYEYEAVRAESGEFVIDITYEVEPQSVVWTGPLAVLIDGFTVSSGEGIAMAVGPMRADSIVVGFERTAASFGFTGPSVSIGGREIAYPNAQSWDSERRVQLDSDDAFVGGVETTHRVEWTTENRVAYASGADVVLNEAVALLAGE